MLLEVAFMPSQQFDSTIPGLLWVSIKDDFPLKESRSKVLVSVKRINDKGFEFIESPSTLFVSDSKSEIVQVGKDILTINNARTYLGEEKYNDLAAKVLKNYFDIFQEHPKIRQISLKLILAYDIQDSSKFHDHFKIHLPVANGYPDTNSVSLTVDYEINSNNLTQSIKTGHINNADKINWITELTFSNRNPEEIHSNNISEWIKLAHKEINKLISSIVNHE